MKPALHPARILTAEEFARLPDDGRRSELVRGQVKEMCLPGYRHGKGVNRIQRALSNFVFERHLGDVVADVGFIVERAPDTVLGPDCAFISKERIPYPAPVSFFPVAPDLAVEVLSPGDRPGETAERIERLLAAGTAMVWIIDPDRREVRVHRPEGDPAVLRAGDILGGAEVLTGFEIPVADLFD
jgi:Uma2 family endonuclease